MAPRCDAKLLFCILFLSCCCYTAIEGQMVVDCCLNTSETPIDKKIIKDYVQQISGQGCSLDAVIFETRRSVHLCAPVNRQWVNDLIKHVDDRKKFCIKHNYKGKRCRGLRPK